MTKWGIWGFGFVGKSALAYLKKKHDYLGIYDERPLTDAEHALLPPNAQVYLANEREHFFQQHTHILVSPGIDCSVLRQYDITCVHELDLFCPEWKKPLIGVTGTVGKTTLVSCLSALLSSEGYTVATGGNIGVPMLDLIRMQETADYGLLELSSFQLEHAQICSPDLAIWTNFYPNHLDRHKNLANYFTAKCTLLMRQKKGQQALVPLALRASIKKYIDRPLCYFTCKKPTDEQMRSLEHGAVLYYLNDTVLKKFHFVDSQLHTTYIDLALPLKSIHQETRACLYAVGDILSIGLPTDLKIVKETALEHRMEYSGLHNGISFYNDSKATVLEATYAAVTHLTQPVHLLLGGQSKGVDRIARIGCLKSFVRHVYCFGSESEQLSHACQRAQIPATSYSTLSDAFEASIAAADRNESILLSPGGASFDLYANYQERGRHFKQLVCNMKKNESSL